MSSAAQRAELQSQIWKIANDVRGSVDGWDFKQYVLGTLFYRFISENFSNYIEAGDESVNYAELPDTVITKDIMEDAIKTKGYFIYPSQLFCNIAKNANTNESLNTDLAKIFSDIESSANGYPSELDIKGLFADFDTTSNRLGNTVKDKNFRLSAVIKGVEGLNFGKFEDNHIRKKAVAEYPNDYEMQIYSYEKFISERKENNECSKELIDLEQKKKEARKRIADLKAEKAELEKTKVDNSKYELLSEPKNSEKEIAKEQETEEKTLSPITNKSNMKDSNISKDNTNNKSLSWWKKLWS